MRKKTLQVRKNRWDGCKKEIEEKSEEVHRRCFVLVQQFGSDAGTVFEELDKPCVCSVIGLEGNSDGARSVKAAVRLPLSKEETNPRAQSRVTASLDLEVGGALGGDVQGAL